MCFVKGATSVGCEKTHGFERARLSVVPTPLPVQRGLYRLRKNSLRKVLCNKGTTLVGPQIAQNQRGLQPLLRSPAGAISLQIPRFSATASAPAFWRENDDFRPPPRLPNCLTAGFTPTSCKPLHQNNSVSALSSGLAPTPRLQIISPRFAILNSQSRKRALPPPGWLVLLLNTAV